MVTNAPSPSVRRVFRRSLTTAHRRQMLTSSHLRKYFQRHRGPPRLGALALEEHERGPLEPGASGSRPAGSPRYAAGARSGRRWSRHCAGARPDPRGPKDYVVLSRRAGSQSERTVWPVTVGYLEIVRHLIAWCELRQDFRSFRTDRVTAAGFLDERDPERQSALRAKRPHPQPRKNGGLLAMRF